jgi:hypothetical protein
MLSATDLPSGKSEEGEYDANYDDDDANRPDDRDPGDKADDQQEDPQHNQDVLLSVVDPCGGPRLVGTARLSRLTGSGASTASTKERKWTGEASTAARSSAT